MNPENLQPDNETSQFLWRRLAEECPTWAIFVPVLFAFLVVGLIVIFRQDKKLLTALVGGGVVGVFSIFYLFLGFFLVGIFSWMVILIPVLGVALFYVGLMYLRDARSVHPLWASFLGLLRTTVYMILAVVFLMPGCQHFDRQESHSKVLVFFDVSDSMFVKDDLPEDGQDPGKVPSRQDKILKFLAANADEEGRDKVPFIDRLLGKSQLSIYRFGAVLDESTVLHLDGKKDKTLAFADASKFLKPNKNDIPAPDVTDLGAEAAKEKLTKHGRLLDLIDTLRSGTNIGGSLLQGHKLENSSYIQAIIVYSDGQSNVGSDAALMDFQNRVNNSRRPIPVFTVGVGQFRMPASIRIDDIIAPEETRPDDNFKIRVPVVSTGLQGEPFTVNVWMQRKKDVTGKDVDEAPIPLGEKPGIFKGAGDFQEGKVEYEVDLQQLKGIKSADDKAGVLEGEWHVWAKVPRAAFANGKVREAFPDPFHVSEIVKVQVQKRALRVLLFAGGATREYIFVRTIIYREMLEKRMELCICNQSTLKEEHIDQDVEPKRMLGDFPTTIGPNLPGQEFMSLSDYDVIIAFDPDWSRLTLKQRKLVNEWVGVHAGGIIFVAGPVHTYQLARPGGQDFSSILPIYPVVPKDSRLHGTDFGGVGHDTSRPYALNFNPVPKNFDFLKLDEAGESYTAGWKGFFWNNEKISDAGTMNARPKRGFFTYYPVERLKPATQVAATFAGPKEARIGPSDDFKDQMPFIATMPYGSGKSMFIGSGEFWRLRAYKDGFQERLWIKMARHVAAGATQRKKYGGFLMVRTAPVGPINVEAEIKGKDLLPLPMDERPTVMVKRVDKNRPDGGTGKDKNNKEVKSNLTSFVLEAKPTDGTWRGTFVGKINIKEPGEYEFSVPIKNLPSEALRATLTVRKPNPELDNVRTNFAYLYQLASEAKPVLDKLTPELRKEVEDRLQVPAEQAPADGARAAKRLFFPLSSADDIAKCLVPVPPKTDITKGRFEDLWDSGYKTNRFVDAYWAALLAPLVIGVIGVLILLVLRQWISAIVFFGICVLMSVGVAATDLIFKELLTDLLPVDFSYLLLVIVSLLGIEWLARKLLRLA